MNYELLGDDATPVPLTSEQFMSQVNSLTKSIGINQQVDISTLMNLQETSDVRKVGGASAGIFTPLWNLLTSNDPKRAVIAWNSTVELLNPETTKIRADELRKNPDVAYLSGSTFTDVFPFAPRGAYDRFSSNGASYQFTKVAYSPQKSYYDTLDTIYDPEQYINMLILHNSAGVNLANYIQVTENREVSPYTNKSFLFANVFVSQNRAKYEYYIKRFREVILTHYLNLTMTNVLDIAKLDDLPAAVNAYNVLINRIIPRIRSLIGIPGTHEQVYTIDPVKGMVLKPEITPERYLLAVGTPSLTLNVKVGTRTYYETIPAFSEEGPREWPYAPVGDAPTLARVSVTYPDRVRTAQEALLYETDLALQLILANKNKLEAKIAQLEDKKAIIEPSEASLDIYQNPFLIYDKAASGTSGTPVFRNVATSVAKQALKSIPVSKGPSVEYYLQAPDIYNKYRRSIALTDGGAISPEEALQLTTKKKTSNLPLWLAAGAGLLVVGSQLL